MNKIENIVFDIGNVLIGWKPEKFFQTVFDDKDKMNYFLENVCSMDWNLKQDKGRSLADGTRMLQLKFPKFKDEIALFYPNFDKMIDGEIKENVALLEPLKSNYKVLALSNWSIETFPETRKKFPFLNIFDDMVLSGEEKTIKPEKKIYKILLERNKIKARHCLFIDDNIKNIEMAKALGFVTIHYTPEVNLKAEMIKLGITI